MKKLFIYTAIVVLACSVTVLSSCKKLLKYDLPLKAGYVIVRIPPGDSMVQVSGAGTNYVNIDSVVKAGTGTLFGFKNITSAKLTSVTMYLINGNDSNNFANFQNCSVTCSTNSGTNFSSIFEVDLLNNPDTYSTFITIPLSSTQELKSYLIGNQFNFTGGGLLRRKTTDTLKCQMQMEFNLHIN